MSHDQTDETAVERTATRPARSWFRSNGFIAFLAIPWPYLGFFFLGFIAIVLLSGDRSRDLPSRVGGSVLIFAWIYAWTLAGFVTPYVGFTVFGIAAYYLATSARRRRSGDAPGGWATPAVLAATATALAVVGLVPHGVRSARFDADEAATRVLAAREAGTARTISTSDVLVYGARALQDEFEPVEAEQRLVEPARFRFTNAPIYYVVLFEQNPETARTGDGEPCFSASETLTIHGISGDVVNLGRQDAREEDGGCLPLLRGTRADLEPVE